MKINLFNRVLPSGILCLYFQSSQSQQHCTFPNKGWCLVFNSLERLLYKCHCFSRQFFIGLQVAYDAALKWYFSEWRNSGCTGLWMAPFESTRCWYVASTNNLANYLKCIAKHQLRVVSRRCIQWRVLQVLIHSIPWIFVRNLCPVTVNRTITTPFSIVSLFELIRSFIMDTFPFLRTFIRPMTTRTTVEAHIIRLISPRWRIA